LIPDTVKGRFRTRLRSLAARKRRPTAFPNVLLKVNAPFELEKQKPSAHGIRVDGFLRTALVWMPSLWACCSGPR
jgi:hypothetical protein